MHETTFTMTKTLHVLFDKLHIKWIDSLAKFPLKKAIGWDMKRTQDNLQSKEIAHKDRLILKHDDWHFLLVLYLSQCEELVRTLMRTLKTPLRTLVTGRKAHSRRWSGVAERVTNLGTDHQRSVCPPSEAPNSGGPHRQTLLNLVVKRFHPLSKKKVPLPWIGFDYELNSQLSHIGITVVLAHPLAVIWIH